jgi:hypothetical protein
MSYERLAKHNFFAKVNYYNTKSELFVLNHISHLSFGFEINNKSRLYGLYV